MVIHHFVSYYYTNTWKMFNILYYTCTILGTTIVKKHFLNIQKEYNV